MIACRDRLKARGPGSVGRGYVPIKVLVKLDRLLAEVI
jgi:hypothetical protein